MTTPDIAGKFLDAEEEGEEEGEEEQFYVGEDGGMCGESKSKIKLGTLRLRIRPGTRLFR